MGRDKRALVVKPSGATASRRNRCWMHWLRMRQIDSYLTYALPIPMMGQKEGILFNLIGWILI